MSSATERAMNRLDSALQGLEFAVQQRMLHLGSADSMAEEVEMLSVDRARLAENLDQSQARALRLENANRNASRLVAAALGAIRATLGGTRQG